MQFLKYMWLTISLAILNKALFAQISSPNLVQEELIKVSGITVDNQIFGLSVAQKQTSRLYFDGLGRPVQQIAVQASPSQKDIIIYNSYNNLGQQAYSYLPYVGNDGSGAFHTAAPTEQIAYFSNGLSDKVIDDTKPWSQSVIESSPLQRILYVGMDGDKFQPNTADPNQHYKTVNYRSYNSSAYTYDGYNGGVRLWNTDGTSSGTYATGSLSVKEVTDEAGNTSVIYKDMHGRLILKRQLIAQTIEGQAETCLDTYCIYDDIGELLHIIPPKALVLIRNNNASPWNISLSTADKFIYHFTYDSKGRLITKKVPGSDWQYVVYDPFNRPVLVQDGNLRSPNKWLYFKYDYKGRVVSQGVYIDAVNGATQAAMQTYVNGLSGYNTYYYEERLTSGGTSPNYYTNRVFPVTNQNGSALQDLSYEYYDDYDLNNDGTADYSYQAQSLSNEATPTSLTRGVLTVSFKKTLNNDASLNGWLASITFYDKRGNTIQVLSNNHTNVASIGDRHTIVPDFTGKQIQTKTSKTVNSTTTTVLINYAYDHVDRLKTIDQSNNGAASIRVGEYVYNELGQVVTKKLHSTDNINFLQNVDFRYNIRDKLTSINNSTLTVDNTNYTNSDNNDVFGEEILYEKIEAALGNAALFNGNISAVKWKALPPAGNTNQRSYIYSYDQLNRITMAHYSEWNSSSSSWSNAVGYNDEKNISYDHNGNIKQLQRYAGNALIDDLSYSYDGNQLANVADGSGNSNGFNGTTATAFSYDYNGNLSSDPKKGVTLSYNVLNKTDKIVFTGNSNYIRYTYDAVGSLLRKEVYVNSTSTTTTYDYIDGFVYQNNTLSYFAMAEGRVRNNGGTLTFEYFIKDHLGNVRVSFESNAGTIAVRQENSYYPFGMTLPGNYVPTQPNNNLFNGGAEWQNDFGNLPDLYQTYFRNYDAALGRFIAVDPMAVMYESITPYQFALNNPVLFNDPFGDVVPAQPSLPSEPPPPYYKPLETVYIVGYKNNSSGSSGVGIPVVWSGGYGGSDDFIGDGGPHGGNNGQEYGWNDGSPSGGGYNRGGPHSIGGGKDPLRGIIERSMQIKAGGTYDNKYLYYTGMTSSFQNDVDQIAHTTVGSLLLAMIESWGIKIRVEDVKYTSDWYEKMNTTVDAAKNEIVIHYGSISSILPGESVISTGAIILFHEMVHAVDIISMALHAPMYIRPINPNSKYFDTDLSGNLFKNEDKTPDRNRLYRELRAVMLENMFRKEIHAPKRPSYGPIPFTDYMNWNNELIETKAPR